MSERLLHNCKIGKTSGQLPGFGGLSGWPGASSALGRAAVRASPCWTHELLLSRRYAFNIPSVTADQRTR
eukprot:738282-Pelagomonas_calceolata.AAC.2